MKKLQLIDIVYKNAPDSQKVWIETTNKYWLDSDLKLFRKILENHVKHSKSLAYSILNQLPMKPRMAVDIGAGYGGVAINLALKQIRTIAVEPGRNERLVLRHFLKKYPKAKEYLYVVNGIAEKLPFAKNSVDLCIMSQVLEHVQDPKKTMSEIARVLKPGGYLHLSCPNYLFPAEQHYKILYFPLMPKRLFAAWALFLYRKLNIKNIKNTKIRDFSKVINFIDFVNYTTDKMVVKLCLKNNLKIVWSARDRQKNPFNQIVKHWQQNKTAFQILLIIVSLPVKFARSILAIIGILPMKLEYLVQKNLIFQVTNVS